MPGDASPTARALRALELLQAQPGITASGLAAELGVSERAARRYVAILREAEIPVESTRGPYGGYRLGRGLRLPPLVFSAAEALGLVMAVLDGSAAGAEGRTAAGAEGRTAAGAQGRTAAGADMGAAAASPRPAGAGADGSVTAALDKILRALPEHVGRPAATLRRHARAAPDRGATRPGPDTTTALAAAVADRRRVNLTYRSESGRQWEEDVDPWAVVVRHGSWYLLCHSHRAGGVRTYRIDRIQAVAGRDQRFRAPEDLDPVALLEQHLGLGWEFSTRVVFDAAPEEVARYVRPPMGRLEPVDEGRRCVLVGTTSNPTMYAGEWLARFPVAFSVEGGPELRAAVVDLAARLTAAAAGHVAVPE